MRLVTGISMALLVVLVTLTVACASAVPLQIEPTPNIDATVEAKVAIALTKIPTVPPNPTPPQKPDKPRIDPTLEALVRERVIESLYTEYESAIYEMIGAVSNPAILRFYLGPKDEYVAAYVARECLYGRKLETSVFRSFVQEMFRDMKEGEPSPISVHSIGVFKILLDTADMKIGPRSENCIKPYTYPSTVNEARLTSNLLRIFRIESVAPFFYDAVRKQYDNWALGWVSNKDRGNRPLLPWICYEKWPEICPQTNAVIQN